MLIFLFLLLFVVAKGYEHIVIDENGKVIPSRYDYKFAAKYEFYFGDNKTIPYYSLVNDAIPLQKTIRLTNDIPAQAGGIWAQNTNPYANWQLIVGFTAKGAGAKGGEGVAIWYTRERATKGPVFGSADKWHGLGIFADTFDQDEKGNNPSLYAIVNDGHLKYNAEQDGQNQVSGICFKDFRGSPLPYWLRITYVNKLLRVESAHHGKMYELCFEKKDVVLPKDYYFGVSASTHPNYPDQHELYLMELYEVDHKLATKTKGIPYNLSAEEQQIFNEYKAKYVQLSQKKEGEQFGGADKSENFYFLSKIEENQQWIIEALKNLSGSEIINMYDKLEVKLASLSREIAVNNGEKQVEKQVASQDKSEINELVKRLESIESKLKQVAADIEYKFAHSNSKLDSLVSSLGQLHQADMSLVHHVTSDAEFQQLLQSNLTKLVVIDFNAAWCGPCKMISPIFDRLSVNYPHVKFLSVNVDSLQETAQKHQATSLPTFQYYLRGNKVAELKGADPTQLEELIKKHMTTPTDIDTTLPSSQLNIGEFINLPQVHCLNEKQSHSVANIFKKGDGYLESDCDEQLIIVVPFQQPVKVHSIRFKAPKEKCPRTIKLFINRQTIGFDEMDSIDPVQIIELKEKDIESWIPLKFVKFQCVTELAIFVENNQGDSSTTVIKSLDFAGMPIQAPSIQALAKIKESGGQHGQQ